MLKCAVTLASFSARFKRQIKRFIINSTAIYEAELTLKPSSFLLESAANLCDQLEDA